MSRKNDDINPDKDILEQENDNPDRPPVSSDSTDHDPFDPFETAHLADGGAVVNDSTEITFQNVLDTARPATTVSPNTSNNSIQNCTSHVTLREGTLLADVANLLEDTSREASYVLNDGDNDIVHNISFPDMDLRLYVDNKEVIVTRKSLTESNIQNVTERTYSSFRKGFAACIEAVDWGALPPRQKDPNIWEYKGFSLGEQRFIEYVNGKSNRECGNHQFKNTDANYKIKIESYSCRQTQGTIAIIDITNTKNNRTMYRRRFNGQKDAFEFIFDAVRDTLSSTIELHEGKFGDETKIPSINNLRL